MQKPLLPENEVARLSTLKSLNLLDKPPQERFDRITRLARKLFNVPTSLVTLVDTDRQWFLSAFGLDVKETSRNISFCGHAILGDEVFTVNDATEDIRFTDNPLVTGSPNIRFYAGCPISAFDGSKVGTLCIFDQNPRELKEEEQSLLQDLSDMVAQEINTLQLAIHDELTNVSNKRGFSILAEYALTVCMREGKPLCLIYIDLDNFKRINDVFGHAEGDRALQAFGNLLRSTFRQSDVLGRIGGDEFALLFSRCAFAECSINLHRLLKALSEYNATNQMQYHIEVSAGMVEFDPKRHTNIDDMLNDADALMYKQKRN
ncbi:MAG: GGDEF domain-containing protein [Methylotenera sp.]|nr:MAG: GGDEF domain-containing protein [Methylotenera sp.]